MKNLGQVIRRPLITEKGILVKEQGNKVIFEVNKQANKVEIRQVVEKMFKVKVLTIRTLNMVGKKKRVGRIIGRRSNWKKAYVTLPMGETVEFFEGA